MWIVDPNKVTSQTTVGPGPDEPGGRFWKFVELHVRTNSNRNIVHVMHLDDHVIKPFRFYKAGSAYDLLILTAHLAACCSSCLSWSLLDTANMLMKYSSDGLQLKVFLSKVRIKFQVSNDWKKHFWSDLFKQFFIIIISGSHDSKTCNFTDF